MIELKKHDKYLTEIKTLYENAFSENERCEFEYLLNGRYPNFDMLAITEGNIFVGFIFVAIYKSIAYINYFAIKEELRNSGYGSKALSLVKEKYKNYTIMLSIEKPVAEIQRRRQKFYFRNDFVDVDFQLKTNDIDYQVLCHGHFYYNLMLEFFKVNFPKAQYKNI